MARSKTIKKKVYGGIGSDYHTPMSSPSSLTDPLSRNTSLASTTSYASADDGLLDCPICLEKLRNYENGRYVPNGSLYTTVCNHEFHFVCARNHFMRDNRCPMCRTHINDFEQQHIPHVQHIDNQDIDDLERRLELLLNEQNINNNQVNEQIRYNDLLFNQRMNDIYYDDNEDGF